MTVGGLLAPGVAGAAQEADVEPRIVVSPDHLVSRDGDRPHVEIMAAANPRNPRNLLAGAITFTRRDGGAATKAYVSRDGGIVWDDVIFPEQREMGGADPQVAFTAAGTALFLTLTTAPDGPGIRARFCTRTGRRMKALTWSDVYDLGASYDHPMLVADQTTGPFAGRVYVSVLYGGLEYSLGVFRSEDDGRSWIGPAKSSTAEGSFTAPQRVSSALSRPLGSGNLLPGGVSGAMLWRLGLVEPIRIPNLHVFVAGREVP